jgi:hypothetical protein
MPASNPPTGILDRAERKVSDIRRGRFERTMSALTAAAAIVTAVEIHFKHHSVIVSCGVEGATVLQRLARAGWSAVAFDAGPFWEPETDWVSDEAGPHKLYRTEPRVIAGSIPVPLGSNNSGRGVRGPMGHYAEYTPRFHPSYFHTLSWDGVRADCPIGHSDLRQYYEDIQAELPNPVSSDGELFLCGAIEARITAKVGPVAIANGRFGHRQHCI